MGIFCEWWEGVECQVERPPVSLKGKPKTESVPLPVFANFPQIINFLNNQNYVKRKT
jgi:hypothetical protein